MKMEKHTKIGLYLGFLSIGILLVAFGIVKIYQHQSDQQANFMKNIFDSVVQIESKKALKEVPFHFGREERQDSITIEKGEDPSKERLEHSSASSDLLFSAKVQLMEQLYISLENPNRASTLDSLFQMKLQENDISAMTAVRCVVNGQISTSTTDSLFFVKAKALAPVVYGVPEKPTVQVQLQPYIQIHPFYLMRQIGGFLALSFLIIIALCAASYRGYKRLMNDQSLVVEFFEDKPQVELHWLKLTEDLLFEENQGVLKYQDHEVVLKCNRLIVFIAFLHAPNRFLSYEELFKLLEYPVSGAGKSSDRNVITQTINGLRKDCEPISSVIDLTITNTRNKGYTLFIEKTNHALINEEKYLPE